MFAETLAPVTSADLNLEQLIGARVEMVYARPYMQMPMVETCTVLEYTHSKRGEFQMLVQPDNPRLFPKWRSEHDFIAYANDTQIAEVSAQNIA
jgi:hypothetical protein